MLNHEVLDAKEEFMALTLKPPKPLTDDELLEFSRRNPGMQFERSATGELIVTPTGSDAGRRNAQLAYQLEAWNRSRSLGVVFDSSTGFRMPDGALLSPDASWVRRDRWEGLAAAEREGFAPLCPDVVFEIASTNNTRTELEAKMRAYITNGAQAAVLIDPQGRRVEIYRPGRKVEVDLHPGTISLDPPLAGFTLTLAPLME